MCILRVGFSYVSTCVGPNGKRSEQKMMNRNGGEKEIKKGEQRNWKFCNNNFYNNENIINIE